MYRQFSSGRIILLQWHTGSAAGTGSGGNAAAIYHDDTTHSNWLDTHCYNVGHSGQPEEAPQVLSPRKMTDQAQASLFGSPDLWTCHLGALHNHLGTRSAPPITPANLVTIISAPLLVSCPSSSQRTVASLYRPASISGHVTATTSYRPHADEGAAGGSMSSAWWVTAPRAATAWRVRRTPVLFSQSSMRAGRPTRTRASRTRPSSGGQEGVTDKGQKLATRALPVE